MHSFWFKNGLFGLFIMLKNGSLVRQRTWTPSTRATETVVNGHLNHQVVNP